MSSLEWLRAHAESLPLLAKFAVALAVIVIVPQISRRIRLPLVVGLLLCGVLFGPYGLQVAGKNRPIADFLAELGKLMLMFIAGLEIDLGLFRQVQRRSMTFGLITTSLPLILGTLVGSCMAIGRLQQLYLFLDQATDRVRLCGASPACDCGCRRLPSSRRWSVSSSFPAIVRSHFSIDPINQQMRITLLRPLRNRMAV